MKVDQKKLKKIQRANRRLERRARGVTRFQAEGLAATSLVAAICLTVTAMYGALSPPGAMAATVDTVKAGQEVVPDMKVTDAQMLDTDLTKLFVMSAKTVSGSDAEEDMSQAMPVSMMMTEDAAPAAGEAEDIARQAEDVLSKEAEGAAPEDAGQANEMPVGELAEDAGQADEMPVGEPAEDTGQADEMPVGEPAEDIPEEAVPAGLAEEPGKPAVAASIVDGTVNVRTEADEASETAGVLKKGAGGVVLERSDGWTRIQSGSFTGWVSDSWLVFGEEAQLILEQSVPTATITVASLNVRKGPGMEYGVLGTVHEGESLEAESVTDNGWVEVAWKDGTGYVSAKYADVDGSLDTTMAPLMAVSEDVAPQAESVAAYAGSASELEMLATIIYCEAGNQPWEGKVAVGNVVLNRIASGSFPNDMDSVLRAPSQFTPVGSGKYDRMLGSGRVPQSCYDAAQAAMDGESYVGGCLYFKNPKIAGAHDGTVIGEHVFW